METHKRLYWYWQLGGALRQLALPCLLISALGIVKICTTPDPPLRYTLPLLGLLLMGIMMIIIGRRVRRRIFQLPARGVLLTSNASSILMGPFDEATYWDKCQIPDDATFTHDSYVPCPQYHHHPILGEDRTLRLLCYNVALRPIWDAPGILRLCKEERPALRAIKCVQDLLLCQQTQLLSLLSAQNTPEHDERTNWRFIRFLKSEIGEQLDAIGYTIAEEHTHLREVLPDEDGTLWIDE